MTSLHEHDGQHQKPRQTSGRGSERRQFRRHDMEPQGITVERVDANQRTRQRIGDIVDISAGGVRIRTTERGMRADNQIRVRLVLPDYAGISPFVDTSAQEPSPKREWVGWMTINRVIPAGGDCVDIAGRLVDMEEIDRGMLGLYLSTQPLAA